MGAEGAGNPIWSVEYWSNLSNLVGVFVLGAAVPVVTRLLRRWEKMREEKKKNIDKHTMELITGVTNPMEKKMDEVERTNKHILTNLNNLSENFDEFLKEQRKVNVKVEVMDKIFQDNISYGNNRRSSVKQQNADRDRYAKRLYHDNREVQEQDERDNGQYE